MYGSHFIPDLISLRRLRVIFKATFPRFLSSLLTPSLLCAQTALLSRTHSLSVHFHRNTVCVRACASWTLYPTRRHRFSPLAASNNESVCRRESKKDRSEHEVPARLDAPRCNDRMSAAHHFCHIRYVIKHAHCCSVGAAGLR